jgi:hypothetical protein
MEQDFISVELALYRALCPFPGCDMSEYAAAGNDIDRVSPRGWEKTLSQCHFAYHKYKVA